MLYFGPEIEAEEKKEYWHGDLWAESPLFGQENITINGGNLIYFYCHKIVTKIARYVM